MVRTASAASRVGDRAVSSAGSRVGDKGASSEASKVGDKPASSAAMEDKGTRAKASRGVRVAREVRARGRERGRARAPRRDRDVQSQGRGTALAAAKGDATVRAGTKWGRKRGARKEANHAVVGETREAASEVRKAGVPSAASSLSGV